MAPPTAHIEAEAGEIADVVLLPGDPLRRRSPTASSTTPAAHRVRNMLGFTGTYRGDGSRSRWRDGHAVDRHLRHRADAVLRRHHPGAGGLVRRVAGPTGSRDVVVATAAHTDSAMNRRHSRASTSPHADFDLVEAAVRLARGRDLPTHVGTILSSDSFYDSDPAVTEALVGHGVLAVEMEGGCCTASPWPTAAGACALARGERPHHPRRGDLLRRAETGFVALAELALDTVVDAVPPP